MEHLGTMLRSVCLALLNYESLLKSVEDIQKHVLSNNCLCDVNNMITENLGGSRRNSISVVVNYKYSCKSRKKSCMFEI